MPNAIILGGGNLTVSGANNITTSGLVTGTGADADRTLTSSITGPAALVIAGGLNLGAGTNTAARTLTLGGTGLTTISSSIADGNAFANNLTVTNSGTTTLSGTNTYTGLTTMNAAAGILVLQGSNTSAGTTTITAGTVRLDSATNGGLASGLLTLNGGTLQALTSARSINNAVTIAASSTVSGSQSITWSGGLVEATGGNANRTLTNNLDAGQLLTITGTVNVGATGTTAARTFTITGTGDTSITGPMVNNTAFAHVLAKSGSGTLTLSNTGNAYTGGTVINFGTVRTAASNVLPGTGTITINATTAGTALLDLNGNSDAIAALTFGGTGGLATSVNQVTTGTGTLTLGGTVTVTATGNWTTPASISGNLGLGAARTFTVGDSTGTVVDLDIPAVVSGAFAITKNGQGTMQLGGTNTYTGATTVTDGQLFLDYSTNNTSKIAAAAGLTVGGATNELNPNVVFNGNATAPTTQTFTTLTANAGSSNIVVTSNGGQAFTLNMGSMARAVGGTVDITLPAVGNVTSTQTLSNGLIGGHVTINNGASFASKDGSNNLVAPTYALKDDVSTWLAADNVIDTTGFTSGIADCATVNSITFGAAASSVVTSNGRFGLNSGGILVQTTATAPSITGGTLQSSTGDIIVHEYSAADLTISSLIRNAAGVTKTGTGALVLSSANNTFTGAVTITEGTVRVTGGGAIGDFAPVTLKNIAGSGLQLLANETVGNITGGGVLGGSINIGANTLTTNTSANITYSGLISGSGTLVKQGTANFNLDTVSHTGFNGNIVINQGLVFLSGNGVVNMPAVSSITSNQGGAFLIDFNSGTTLSSRVNDVAAMNLSSFGNGAFFGLHIRSSQAANHSETVGAINLQGGAVGVGLVQSSGTQTLTLTGSQLNRTNNATLVLDGNNLGSTASVGRTRMFITAAPAIVGGTGVAGGTATNVSIVPYAVSTTNAATAVAVADIPNTFVNYNATTGMTPLLIASEYKLDSAGYTASADPTDNLRFTAGVTGLVTKTFNAAVFDSSAAAMSVSGAGGGGNVLTVGSGAMLFTSTAAANATTLDGFDSITPGAGSSNEWIITAATTAAPTTPTGIINSVLTDGVGATTLTKSGTGILVLGAANLYSGPTVFNQGAIRASNLSNLGTGTALNFFGGTLQFGGVFDPSTRAITFNALGGGGTFDTNGNDISIANPIGNSGNGSFTKTGAGNLTINAAATHTGGTTVANGTLTVGVANMLPATSSLTVNGATATLDVGAFAQTVGTFTLAAGTVTGAGPITSSDIQLQAGTQNASNVLAGGTVVKTTTGVVTLAGANTFTGQIFATNGEISFNSIADANGTASALGAPTNALQGAIQLGLGTNTPILTYTGSGHTSNRTIELVGTTGTSTINANGAGALSIGAVTSEEYGAKSLVLSGTSASGIVNKISAPITECFGVVTLQKLGTNTWQLDAASTYTGATQIDEGVLRVGIDNALPVATAVRLGNGTTAGTFDLNGFNQTIGSLTSSTNSTTATNIINVPTGKTLTINGAVTLGANVDVSTTLVNATGGGSIVVNSGGANFQVGGATGATNENTATVDFTGLSTFTANLGAGTFRIGDANTSSGTAAPATMKLAPTSTITAALIRVGDSSGFANNHTLTLGTGVNTLNADTVNIGSAGTGIRSSGTINFAAGDTTGSVKIRASDGSSAATLNMVNTSGSTTGNIDGTMDFTGHTADLKFNTVTMAARSVSTGAATATLNFDQGFFDAVTVNIASRTGAGTGNATGTLNLGDSAAPGSPTTTIGTVNMAVNTSGGGTVVADMNITGGAVNLGPVNMANAAASRTATATLDITGGTTTLSGNITRTGGAGTENATVTLDGGTLDMAANSIGAGTTNVTLVAASGTLKNLGQLNGGGAFSKTTAGTLTLEGVNTYTGDTTVSAGTLVVNNSSGSGTGSGSVTVNATTTLAGNGSIAPTSGKSITLNGTTVVGTPGSVSAEDFAMTVAGAANIALNGTIKFDIFANANNGTLNPTLTSNDLLTITAADWINALFGVSSVLKVETSLDTSGWAHGDAWKIFDWSGLSGTAPTVGSGGFATLDLPILTGGQAWNTTQLYTTGVISIDAIPEPGRAMLLLVGLLGVGFRRRRK